MLTDTRSPYTIRKRRFDMGECAKKPPSQPTPKIPKASEIKINTSGAACYSVKPPKILLEQLGNPAIVVGFDIESHSWPENSCRKGHIGQFGWYTLKDDATLLFARTVQVGWVIGRADLQAPVVVKSALVKPDGFEVAHKAFKHHGITHEQALRDGRSLAEVLREFTTDVKDAFANGGRVVAHQLEFDAAVISSELHRCGLHALQEDWDQIARMGYCTMNPTVGRWLKECTGEDPGPPTAQPVLGLKDTLDKLSPKASDQFKLHAAQDDAQMTRMAYLALLAHTSAWREAPSSA
jgi:DNA polymerase III epsilon subunit-like protein